MSKLLCKFFSSLCLIYILGFLFLSFYLLFDTTLFINYLKVTGSKNIQWATTKPWQYYIVWGILFLHLCFGLLAAIYLRPVLINFSNSVYFNYENTVYLRRFVFLLLFKAALNPFVSGFSNLLLMYNHPVGQRQLAIGVNGHDFILLFLGAILYILSQSLIRGYELESENKQFV